MLRTTATDIRSVVVTALMLTAVTACQTDGPIGPAKVPATRGPALNDQAQPGVQRNSL